MNVNLLLSMIGPRLDGEQTELFNMVGEWVVLNERNGRLFVDAIGPQAGIDWVLYALDVMGRDPIVLGLWDRDGNALAPVNESAWLAVAPDVVIGHTEGDEPEPIMARPTEFADIHRWQGWQPKEIP